MPMDKAEHERGEGFMLREDSGERGCKSHGGVGLGRYFELELVTG